MRPVMTCDLKLADNVFLSFKAMLKLNPEYCRQHWFVQYVSFSEYVGSLILCLYFSTLQPSRTISLQLSGVITAKDLSVFLCLLEASYTPWSPRKVQANDYLWP